MSVISAFKVSTNIDISSPLTRRAKTNIASAALAGFMVLLAGLSFLF